MELLSTWNVACATGCLILLFIFFYLHEYMTCSYPFNEFK